MTINTQLPLLDRNLVSAMSPVGFGTIIKGWRGSKGIDYIIVGINTTRREIYAIKHNAINEDGTVHSFVNRHRRVFKYTLTPSSRAGIVKGITSVMGQKQEMNVQAISAFNQSVSTDIGVLPFSNISLFTLPTADRRNTLIYA